MSQDVKEIVDVFLGISLGMLVETGFVSKDLIDKNWYSRFDMNHRLESDGFFAAASIDDADMPVVVFNTESTLEALAWAIPHEAIHLAQMCKKDLEPSDGFSIWKGKKYPQLKATDPNYSSPNYQPWEAEALELEESVRDALYEKFPDLKCL